MPVLDRAMADAIRNRTPESIFVNAFDKAFRTRLDGDDDPLIPFDRRVLLVLLERRRWGRHFATPHAVAERLDTQSVRRVRGSLRRLDQRGLLPFAVQS